MRFSNKHALKAFAGRDFSRRQMLTALGGASAAALLPFVPQLEREAEAQVGGPPMRFLYWYESVMPVRDYVLQMYQNNPGALSFSGPFAPLNDVADKLLFVRDMTSRSMQQSDGGPHPSAGGTYLMGRPWKKGLDGDPVGPADERFGNHSSLDQHLATQIAGDVQTPLSDIRAGYANNTTGRGNSAKSVSILDGRLRLRHQLPKSLYAEMFPFLGVAADDPVAVAQAEELVKNRRSVLDFVSGGLNRLSSKVSAADREKLDQHLTSIREVENRLALIEESGAEVREACRGIEEPPDVRNDRVDLAQDAYIPLITQALACDMTRVAGGHFGSHTNVMKYDFVNSPRRNGSNWHQSTHEGGNENYYDDVLNFRARQFTKLIQGLDSIPEGEGTLLDHTVVLWFTDIPYSHSSSDTFTMIAGAPHYFKLGQMVEAGGNVNRALTSVCHAMGYPLDHFGDPGFGSGTLPASALV